MGCLPTASDSLGLVGLSQLFFDFFEFGSAFGCVGEVFVVEMFGDVAADSDLSDVVEEGAEFVGCPVEVVGVAIEEGVEEPFAAFPVALGLLPTVSRMSLYFPSWCRYVLWAGRCETGPF